MKDLSNIAKSINQELNEPNNNINETESMSKN